MKFEEVLPLLREDNKGRLASWDIEYYIIIRPINDYVGHHGLSIHYKGFSLLLIKGSKVVIDDQFDLFVNQRTILNDNWEIMD